MSPTSPDPEGARPPARRGWRRARRLVLGALGILVTLLFVLESPPARRLLSSALTGAASRALGGEVALDGLDYRIWRGEASLAGLVVRRSGLEIECARAELSVGPFEGLRVAIASPRVVVTTEPSDVAPPTGPSRPWSILRWISSAFLERGRLELRGDTGSPWLSLDGVEVRLERDGDERRGSVRIAKAGLGWPGGGIRLAPVRAEADVVLGAEARTLRLGRARVDAEGATLEASGQLEQLGPVVSSLEARARVDGAVLGRLFPGLDAEGRIEAHVSAATGAQGLGGTVALEASGLTTASVGPWAGSLRGRLDGGRLVVEEVDLRGYGGQATATGELTLGDGRSRLEVALRELDVATLTRGLAGRAVPLATTADADLSVAIVSWDTTTLVGSGRMAFQPAAGTGWPVGGEVELSLGGERLRFDTETLHARGARAALHGSLGFDGDIDVQAALQVGNAADVPVLLADAGLEGPELSLRGSLEARGEVRGHLPDFEATARVATAGLGVEDVDLDLSAAFAAAPAGIEIESFALQGPEGRTTASGFIPLQQGRAWDVHAEIADLEVTDALARRGIAVPAVVQGTLRVTGAVDDPHATFVIDSRLGGEPAPPSDSKGHEAEPEQGARAAAQMHVSGRLDPRGLAIETLTSKIGGGVVEASGAWDFEADRMEGRLRAAGVSLAALPSSAGPMIPEDVQSVLSADVEVSGHAAHPRGGGHLTLSSNTWRGRPLPDLSLEARSDGAEVSVSGRVGDEPFLSGRVGLAEPWPARAELELGALPTEAFLAAAFPHAEGAPLSVALAGRATLELPLRTPRALRYTVGVEHLGMRVTRDLRAGPFEITGDLENASVHGFALTDGRSRLSIEGALGPGDPGAAPLTLRGEIPLDDLGHLLPGGSLAGEATLDLRLHGELTRPDVGGSLAIANGSGRIGPLGFEDLDLRGSARSGVLTLEAARARLGGGEVTARGSLPVGPRAEGTQTLQIDARGVDLGALVPQEPGGPAFTAPLDLSARVRATAPRLDSVEAEGEIEAFTASVGTQAVTLEAPAHWSWSDRRLRHEALRLRGERGEVVIESVVNLAEGGPEARLHVSGAADLAFLNPFFGGALLASGPLRLDLRASGGKEPLSLDGEARLEGGRFRLREPALVLTDVSGRLETDGSSLRLVDLGGRVGNGHVGAEGRVVFGAAGPQATLTLDVKDVPLTYPQGLRSRVSGDLRLEGRAGRYRLGGDVRVSHAAFESDIDGSSRSLDAVDSELQALDARGSLLERVSLDVGVRLEDGLRVQNEQAQLVVDGAVKVRGDLVTPEVDGSVSIRNGGEVRLSRAHLRISQGRVELQGFPGRSPILDIRGMTQVTGVRIDAQLSGPLEDLQTSLSSPNRPDLTQGDLATLILTGRTAQAAASESGAIVAEEVAAALGEALDRKLGGAVFVDVSRDESLIVEDTDPTQRFNVGIPLGPRLYVIHSQPLDRGGRRWIVDLRPRGNLRLRLISDEDGSEAIDVGNRTSFDLWSRGRRAAPERDPPRRVRSVAVTGVADDRAVDLARRAKLGPGDEYDYFAGERASRRIVKHLVGEGYRTASVEAGEEAAGPNAVDVTFHVERGPRVRVEWSGDDPGKKGRRRTDGAWGPYLPIEETASRLAVEVRRDLQARRFYQATAAARVRPAGDDVVVAFEVARGPKGSGVDLTFEGLGALRAQTLAAALPPVDEPAFFALLEPEGRTRLQARLRSAGARTGRLRLQAGPVRAEPGPGGRLHVTIPIEEGPPASVVALDLPDEARSPEDGEPPRLSLREGEAFRIDAYIADRAALASWYRERGYPEVRVVGVLEPVNDDLAVRLGVEAGPRPRVGEVRQVGTTQTRPGVVRRAVTLEPGELIRPSEVARSRERLSETRAFRSVDIRTEGDANAEVRDVVVDLVDRPDVEVEYSVRYTTSGSGELGGAPSSAEGGQVQFGGAIEAVNPFGWAHRYRVYGLAGTKRTLLGTSFDAASFFGRRWRTEVFLFVDDDRDTDIPRLGEHIRGVALQQTKRWQTDIDGRRWHDRLRMQWGYSYRRIDYADLETGAHLGGNRGAVNDSLIGDTRDSLTDPHRGRFWTAGVEVALKALGSDVDYVRLYGQLFLYLPLGSKVVWAQGVRYGFVPGSDPLLLLERRFRAGGATSVRGFTENSLGPRYGDEPIGGQAMFVFNEELRFPLWKTLHGGVFYDAGNVWALGRDLDLGSLRHSAGAGLRLMFPFGPVRLDWGYVLDPQEGEQRSRWHFSIGHAF